MGLREYLRQVFAAKDRLHAKETQVAELREELDKIGRMGAEHGTRQPVKIDRLAGLTADYVDSIAECEREMERLVSVRKDVEALVETLPHSKQKTVLFYRYVLCRKWEDVAASLNYSEENVFLLHRQGLGELAQNYEKLLESRDETDL